MVHSFKVLDDYFLLDSESGSVFHIDRAAHEAVQIMTGNAPSKKEISDDIKEAINELESLKDQGVLFCQPPEPEEVKYNGDIKSMCLNISHRCNLKCKYCFAKEGTYGGQAADMSLEIAKKAIDFLIMHSGKRHFLEIDFFGGEPILNFDVVKSAVEYAKVQAPKFNKTFRFTITTNGVIFNEDQIDFINQNMSNVVISIDGRPEVHNNARPFAGGQESYDKVLKFAKNFRSIRGSKDYYIRGTYTAQNLDFANDVLWINDQGFDQISIEPVVLPYEHVMAIKQEHIQKIKDEYERLAKEYLERRKTQKWFNFFHFMINFEGGPCEKKRVSACSAGNEYVAIAPDGLIYPCHQFVGNHDFVLGDLKNWNKDSKLPLNEEIRNKFQNCNIHTKPKCKNCFAKYYCSGGCAANNYNLNNDINDPVDVMCEVIRKRTECAIAVNILEKYSKQSVD